MTETAAQESHRPNVTAEIGCNHNGEMAIARELISLAAGFAKANVAKFQKRSPRELLSSKRYHTSHPSPMHAYGATYGAHREFLEFSVDEHRQLQEWCAESGIEYSTSVWDLTSAREITELSPKLIKIPSACNTHLEMLGYLCDHFPGEIHVSLGMTSRAEEEQLLGLLEAKQRARDVVLYACTSGYPVPFDDICLLEIRRLRDTYGSCVRAIGFSGHHLGIAVDMAAYTLGARWIERHLTCDRTWKGTDHAVSLEPDGLRRLVRDLEAVSRALAPKSQEILPIERVQRDKLKYGQ